MPENKTIPREEDAPVMKTEKKAADTAAMIALFGTILVVSIALALATDLHIILRAVLSIIAGVIAAAVTHVVVSNRR
ncbi:hypothetical protein JOD62_001268 [Microbacterium keratanolyticum]|uniref:Uncharacterized protein n=1 Tax=Microbacterium keratanolyticum TaxID=67574 RepID=A0A9W6HRH9_9MICO|nr:hypothetical protein [Microbacterium keratanolyticum]MBM7468720.1 hypothetical protein [Microbacterium keratanolyticum]GLK00796.1 hypothetical protein GCM10017596_05110 [Microbacterium keratanolyticum]